MNEKTVSSQQGHAQAPPRLRIFGLTGPRVALFFGLSALAALLEGFGIAMFLPVLEFVEKGRDLEALAAQSWMWAWLVEAFRRMDMEVTLTALLVAAVGMMLLRTGAMYARQVYTAWLGQTVLHTARSRLFAACMALDYGRFTLLSSGTIINLLTTEAQRAAVSYSTLFQMISNGVVVLGFFGVLLWLSVPLTLLAAACLGVSAVVVAFFVRHTRDYSYRTTDANAAYSRMVLERLGGFRLIKLTATADREAASARRASGRVRGLLYRLAQINASVELIMEVLALLVGGIILSVAVGVLGMGLAEVGLFVLILLRLLPLTKEVMKSRQSFQASAGSRATVVEGFTAFAAQQEPGGGGRPFAHLRQGIRFEGVTFAYDNAARPALRDVTLDIPAGRVTALVGRSGAGKTSLADLVIRLRVPGQGRVLYDGVDGAEFDLTSLRKSMAYVSQDAAILDDSVAENLRFANPEASPEQLWEALERAQAAAFVRALPEGLDTRLGERGVLLSGGQKQRLALARVFLQQTSVLILDEPTSALDSETERDIQKVLAELRAEGSVTVLIIAHRLSTIRDADLIVVMKDGGVVEQGHHAGLLAQGGWYARMCAMQNGDGESPESLD
ncbi:ABC transporter ATP-binding protein [Desulfocurvus vexinensis]|uniref:ABC transporter ATP-binding protein n=1 Tax=Desulfocurvus vexinensis TaxID=399548 RepID=UPI0004B3A320|nr:ABC transporter ATP-binding protein [Desulfocurvus vexinensis]